MHNIWRNICMGFGNIAQKDARAGAGAPHSARGISPRLGGGAALAGHERRFRHRFFYVALGGEMRPQGAACCYATFCHAEMHLQGAACRFGKREAPARG